MVSAHGVASKRHTTLRSKDSSIYPLTNVKSHEGIQIPGQATSPHYLNKENTVSGPLPKPHVKIIDLQHNLLPLDSGIHSLQLGGIATSTGQQIMAEGGMRIDAQSLKNQLKQGKKEGHIMMSQHQHYLL